MEKFIPRTGISRGTTSLAPINGRRFFGSNKPRPLSGPIGRHYERKALSCRQLGRDSVSIKAPVLSNHRLSLAFSFKTLSPSKSSDSVFIYCFVFYIIQKTFASRFSNYFISDQRSTFLLKVLYYFIRHFPGAYGSLVFPGNVDCPFAVSKGFSDCRLYS